MRVKPTPASLEQLAALMGEPVFDDRSLAAAITKSERTIARMHAKGTFAEGNANTLDILRGKR